MNLAFRPHDVGRAAAFGEGAHGKGGCHIPLEEHIDGLVVHHVVVAVEHAAAVGAGAQGGVDVLLGGIGRHHGAGPAHVLAPASGTAAGDVDLLRVIGAAVLAGAAVQAAVGRALRRGAGVEVIQRAEALDPYALLAHQPAEDVHVVAALGQDHGAGFVAAPPVAADKAVGVVPVAHVLNGVDRLDLADVAPAHNRC